ncbi:MAG TPA: anhydro-N-acetylmuramic acid kinase [Tepidisphaeraceae bacterium]|jgi:anhydro-N-acetylmuramic acid kinase|nr:anhydro-N-acetylmuramic acid kinase [Tepidisphaeraceae bacterium]
MSQTRLIAGAMSGTSADGVDVVIGRIEGSGLKLSACVVAHHHRPYPAELAAWIVELREDGHTTLGEMAELAKEISLVYAAAVNEALVGAHLSASDLAAIAAHGQTLFHSPPATIQWIDPALVAAETGCPVISDFRRADCAAGGQGAPLVPFADFVLFRHAQKNRVLLNIGGIANLTYLPAAAKMEEVIALDTGPGNCISDWLCRRFRPNGPPCDNGGALALRGKMIEPVVKRVLNGTFFRKAAPRSTDGPHMIEAFRDGFDSALGDHKLENLLATACAITVGAIGSSIQQLPKQPDELIVSGGGTKNQAIMGKIKDSVGSCRVLLTDELGIASASKEALAFALLGAATLDGTPANVVSATGAYRAVVLGQITPKP